MSELHAGPEMDKVIGEQVFRLKIIGQATCIEAEGTEGVYPGTDASRWLCPAEVRYVHKVHDFDDAEPYNMVNGVPTINLEPVPRYSTKLDQAWEVLEALMKMGVRHPMVRYDSDRKKDHWTCALTLHRLTVGAVGVRGDADTAPLAICRAAIAAMEQAEQPKPGGGQP